MKPGFKIATGIIVILLLLNSAFLMVILTYQDEIAEQLKNEINTHFKADVDIGDMNISFFKRFPKVAVVLKDIQIKEDPEFGNENLALIRRIYLFMNPFTFLKKNYIIDKIEFTDGELSVKWDTSGNSNYVVWKESEKKSKSFSLDLRKIILNNFMMNYSNLSTQQEILAEAEYIDFKGFFTEVLYSMEIEANGIIHDYVIKDRKYMENDHLKIKAALQIDNENKSYTIKSSDIFLDEIMLAMNGHVHSESDSTLMLDLSSKASGIDLEKLLIFVPDSSKKFFDGYKLDGKFEFNGDIHGSTGKYQKPHLHIDFGIYNGSIKNLDNNSEISRIRLQGNMDNGDQNSSSTSTLHFSLLSATLDSNSLLADIQITNFQDAFINGEIQAHFKLEDIIRFYPMKKFHEFSGDMMIHAKIDSKLDPLIADIRGIELLDAEMNLDKISIRHDSSKYNLERVSGKIVLLNELLEFHEINGDFAKVHVEADGHLKSLFSYLYDQEQSLTGKIKLSTSAFDLKELLDDPNKNQSNDSLHLPENLDVKIDLLCNGLIYETFVSERIRAWLSFENKAIMIDRLNLDIAQGLISLKGMIEERADALFTWDAMARLNKIDLHEIFILFDNFEQDYITSDHLYGTVNGQVQFSSLWDQNLKLDWDQLFVLSDVTMDHGKLKNFQPLIDLMGFVKMKKMKEIDFDRMENTILIKDRIVTIPYMDIRNSALNMSLAGTHSFEEEIDYHFKINLSELFFKSNKQLKKDFQQAEDDQKGGLNMYVHMFGTASKPVYRMDRRAVKENLNVHLKNEKEEFLDLFRKKQKKANKEEFEFEWEDEK